MNQVIKDALIKLLESKDYIKTLLQQGKSLEEINQIRMKLGLKPLEFIVKK